MKLKFITFIVLLYLFFGLKMLQSLNDFGFHGRLNALNDLMIVAPLGIFCELGFGKLLIATRGKLRTLVLSGFFFAHFLVRS
jgi:hypothetical protein